MADTKVVLPPDGENFIALPVGTRVGRYTITGLLGQGSFGITYGARDDQLGRAVAIKEYLPSVFAVRHGGLTVRPSSTETAESFAWGLQRFTEEGRTLASFQQAPGIVRVYDFIEANGTAYLVMELVQGDTLGARLRGGGRYGAAEVERIVRPLLDGLEKIHATSFVHRDIKPDNILLDAAGLPTLIDFGAARAAIAGRTSALTGIFTPGYAAIEQFTDARQGPWTDIYGLSATLYHAIAGRQAPSAIDRTLKDTLVPLAMVKPKGFAPALLAGIDRGLAVRPEARPQTIAAWRAMLYPTAARAAATRWKVPALVGAAVLVVAVGAVGAWLALAPRDGPVAQRTPAAVPAPPAVERQAADTAAADKQRAEEEAQRQAVAAQQQQQQQREQAEAEARRKAEAEEAQRQADAEAARQRAASDEAARRAAAESEAATRMQAQLEAAAKAQAEQTQRQADEQAARRAASESEAAARMQAQLEAAAARADAERAARAAEAAEAALNLGPDARQRLQLALTAQGFDTRGSDGVFGPRWREMLAAWQRARGLPVTGHLDAAQQQRLLRDSAAALARHDEEQRKAAQASAAAGPAPAPAPASPAAPTAVPAPAAAPSASFDGQWGLVRAKCIPVAPLAFSSLSVQGNRVSYAFSHSSVRAGCTAEIRPDGSFANSSCDAPITGRIAGNRLTMSQKHPEIFCDFEFQK